MNKARIEYNSFYTKIVLVYLYIVWVVIVICTVRKLLNRFLEQLADKKVGKIFDDRFIIAVSFSIKRHLQNKSEFSENSKIWQIP